MRTRILVISDSPFLNFDTSIYSYDLIKLLIKKDVEVYNLILNTVIDTEYDYIKGDFSTLKRFHKDIEFLNEQDKEFLKKVIYVYRCKTSNVENKFLENMIKEHSISIIICCISITSNIRLDDKLSIPLIMNIKIDYEPLTKIHYDLIKYADVMISNTDHGDLSIKKLDCKNQLVYKINPKIDFKYLDEISLDRKNINEQIRKKLNIPKDFIVFLLDLSSTNTIDMERKCLDISINIFVEYLKKNDKSFLIINTVVDNSLKTILKLSGIPGDRYIVINDYYEIYPVRLRDLRSKLYFSADIMLSLSGGEDYSLSTIEAQYIGLPVILNQLQFYEESNYIGEIVDKSQDIYLATDVQTYIKMPNIKNCLALVTKMINNLVKYKINESIRLKMRDKYEKEFDERWSVLLRGF